MTSTRSTGYKEQRHIETLSARHHRESLKQDLIRMARGDQHTPLISTRRRASTSLTDLLTIVDGPFGRDAITIGHID
jgi:hypothetical protein